MNEAATRGAFFSRALRQHWILAVVILVIGALVAAGSIILTQPAYSSTSIVFLQPLAGNPYSPTTPPSRTEQLAALTTEAGLVYTDAVVGAAVGAAAKRGVALPPDMRGDIFTEVPSNSQVVEITYTQTSPELAKAGAQALAESYLGYRKDRTSRVVTAETELRNQQLTSITTLLNAASKQLDQARAVLSVQAKILDLEQQVTLYANQLAQVRLAQTSAEATSITPGDIISPAVLPTVPNGISSLQLTVGVLTLFALFSLLAVLAREHFDQTVRDELDILAADGGPLRGTIRRWKHPQHLTPDIDGYRRLQLVLQSAEPLNNRVLLLAGVSHGTDTSRVAEELATAFDEAGSSVIFVQAIATEGSDASPLPGLTDLLDGEHPPADVWSMLQQRGKHSVLTLGTMPERWDELALRPALSEILSELCANGLVLVAGPSLDTASGVAIANHSAEVVLVIDAKHATVPTLSAALDVLRQIHVEFAGSVLLGRPERNRRPLLASRSKAAGSNRQGSAKDEPPTVLASGENSSTHSLTSHHNPQFERVSSSQPHD